jgi:hypothetical protein
MNTTHETSVSVAYDAIVVVDITPDGKYHLRVDLPFYDDGPTVYDANGNIVRNSSFLYNSAIDAANGVVKSSYALTTGEITDD